jgi:hypothetical protein
MVLVCSGLVAADATPPVRPYLPFRSVSENSARSMVGMGRFQHKVAVETVVVEDYVPVKVAVVQPANIMTIEPTKVKEAKIKAPKNKRVKVAAKKTIVQPVEAAPSENSWGKTKSYVKNVFSKNTVTTEQNTALYTKNTAVEMSSVSTPVGNYGVFSVTPEYTRSFNGDAITQSFFGWWLQDGNKLNITGSEVPVRNEKDLLADWFYLDGAYEGSISFKPVIQNALVDMSFYWGMDAWVEGMYFRAHAPLAWTKWDLGASFKTSNVGVTVQDYIYGAFDPAQGYEITRLDSAEKFFCKKGITNTGDAPGLIYPPAYTATIYHPLTSARFCGCSCDDAKTLVRLSDIQADLGWDFVKRDRWNMGVYARGVAPTGNRPTGRWLFEPIIGNGHHWELGGGLTASAVVWRNDAQDKSINFSLDAHATHLFNALQHRVFDLKNMPLSRYLTAFRSNEPEMEPVANLTATTINSSFAAQGEITALFNALYKNWSLDLGYNFWAQSCEKIECSTWSNSCYGKGIIKNGYNETLVPDASKWAVSPLSTLHTYVPPVSSDVILASDIDYENARSKGMSHKVFGHVSYAWMDRDVVPFIGIGGEGEFGRNEKCSSSCASTCANSCSSTSCSTSSCSKSCCKFASLSQWGVWIKGGVSF